MRFPLYLAALSLVLAAPASAQDLTITIKSFKFMTMDANVTAGSTVTWKNLDEEPHTVTSETGAFRSGGLDTGQSFSFKFDKPGVYKYRCSIHPQMVGTVTVK
jgi:plastocyanin